MIAITTLITVIYFKIVLRKNQGDVKRGGANKSGITRGSVIPYVVGNLVSQGIIVRFKQLADVNNFAKFSFLIRATSFTKSFGPPHCCWRLVMRSFFLDSDLLL